MFYHANKNIETKVCVSKQYIVEVLFSMLVFVMIIFFYRHKMIVLGIASAYIMMVLLYLLYKKKHFDNLSVWQKHKAKVLNVQVLKCICITAYNALEQQRLRHEVYKPDISYTYEWQGKTYTSHQYARSLDDADCNFSYSLEVAKRIADEAKKKKEIDIYVHTKTEESIVTLDVAKGYGIPYVGLSIAGLMFLFLVYKVYVY